MSEQTDIHIRPNSAWFFLDWKGVRDYRDLLWLLIHRDFASKYKQTVLGPAWAVIQPLLLSVVFTVVFTHVANIPTDGVPGFLFYLCGLLLWQLFAGIINAAGNSLQGNANVFGKVYFPRIIPPLSLTLSQLIPFVMQLLIFLGFYAFYAWKSDGATFRLDWALLPMLPVFVLHTCLAGLGVSLFFSALTAKYRDFRQVLGFIVQLWLYATPVIYPADKLDAYAWMAWLNPMAAPVVGTKALFLGSPGFSWGIWVLSVALTVLILLFSLLWYQRAARTFVDTA